MLLDLEEVEEEPEAELAPLIRDTPPVSTYVLLMSNFHTHQLQHSIFGLEHL